MGGWGGGGGFLSGANCNAEQMCPDCPVCLRRSGWISVSVNKRSPMRQGVGTRICNCGAKPDNWNQ